MVDLICELVLCLAFGIVILAVPGFLSSLLVGKGPKSAPTTYDASTSEPHVGSDPH
ncbi:hypothetical protein PZ938_07525 [Luteipulveratus sp. YIM 133132]|uniref:Uncharacterized protein n=1 Tax=Luteipulveratus flavus TaxID=3031728 RepID=A0ABT6CAV7_9MICO|nr:MULTISPECIES: hypothetical protein [unclassified Luteipulveratus]MDE9365452.1 hypothetical protein [Luteipulveratus sp. YIM 133132]MDF8266018.1 hypothetical protein [Luteipulveratus sp. YIM 133296]